ALVTPFRTFGRLDDAAALAQFSRKVDVVTFEFENVDVSAFQGAKAPAPFRPPLRAFEIAQDRWVEKQTLDRLGIAVAPFRAIDTREDLAQGLRELAGPAILKTRRFGYDGKGQWKVTDRADADQAFAELAGAPAILEAYVAFESELSVILARDVSGATEAFPIARNDHENHILKRSTVPGGYSEPVEREAIQMANTLASSLDYVGVLTLELFALTDGRLIVNEIAPRVHNSGHWTLDACSVSQFEQHIRAITGLPLRRPELLRPAVMENLLGPEVTKVWTDRSVTSSLHLYGKSEARDGRKMGHRTYWQEQP
ncbi:MAG: 5-(carboxyamino)imidazole ribonucleotide synthase, partial [Pseudomonadota bacterium]